MPSVGLAALVAVVLACAWCAPAAADAQPGGPDVRPVAVTVAAEDDAHRGRSMRAVRWRAPLTGRLSVARPFIPAPHRYAAGHRGADLHAARDGVVLVAGDGRVSFAGRVAGRGVVVVDHGAIRTTYEPVTPRVAKGHAVRAGDPIGRLALGGSHCLPRSCLHWGARRGSSYLDPLTLLGRAPVRLLPVWGVAGLRDMRGRGEAGAAADFPDEVASGDAEERSSRPDVPNPPPLGSADVRVGSSAETSGHPSKWGAGHVAALVTASVLGALVPVGLRGRSGR